MYICIRITRKVQKASQYICKKVFVSPLSHHIELYGCQYLKQLHNVITAKIITDKFQGNDKIYIYPCILV